MRPLFCVAFSFAAATVPAQQLVLAQNDNPSYGGYAVGWPSSVIAFRFTANVPVLAAAEVFTGNQPPATHTVEIRTRDANTGLPDQLLGAPGAWTTTHTRCWQGAAFAQAANVQVGQDYFLVWRVQGMFPQHSVSADTEPANVLVETRYSDGSTWHAVNQTPGKFRLFVPGTTGTTSSYGSGKAGLYGVPAIGLCGFASVGSPVDVWLGNARRNALAVLVVGLPIPGGVPVGFADLFVTPDVLLTFLTKGQSTPYVGGASHSVFVPNVPAAVGFPLSFQWGVFDASAVDGFAHTGAVTALLQ